jgi:Putative beta-barrel porin-2, OmpL-like. bbp2
MVVVKKIMVSLLQRGIILVGIVFLLFSNNAVVFASEGDSSQADNKTFQSILSAINLTGGISAGYFYASNPGEDTSDDAFLLSNLLVEISSADDTLPVSFVGAFGETSTPSILDTPENNTDLKIEYASLILKEITNFNLEMGLLQPYSGFENTYTFNNKNVILGAVASQQPYNAYGARVNYDMNEISLWGGYYKNRLDDEEYNSPDYTWEIGVSGSIAENDFSIYDYHIGGQRNLLGAVIEHSIGNVDLAFNIDYWNWDNRMEGVYGSKSSIGAAFYICPNFSNFSIPIRIEYINQDESQIYIENPDTNRIYAATFSPTWHFNENAYVRAESAYVKANGAFMDKNGYTKDNRINLAIEVGFLF